MHPILLAYQQYFTALLSYWGLIGIGDSLTTWPGGRFRRVRLAELNKEKEDEAEHPNPTFGEQACVTGCWGQWLDIAVSHLTEHDRAWDTNACLYRQGWEELNLHFPCQDLSVLNEDQSRSEKC